MSKVICLHFLLALSLSLVLREYVMFHLIYRKMLRYLSYTRAKVFTPWSIALLCCIFVSSLLVSCGSAATTQAKPTPTSAPTLAPTSTSTPIPTSTPLPTPTPPPTPTPVPQGAPAILDLQPASMSLVGHLDCQRSSTYICSARVLSRASNQSNLHWTAYTDVPGNVTFRAS